MDEKIKELCIRVADRTKEALDKGEQEKALELIPALTREDRNMHKLLAQVISQFLVPFIQERFIEDQKKMGEEIEQAIKEGDKEKAIKLIDAKTSKWMKLHDLYIDFMGDTFGWISDNLGQQGLFDFYRKWGDGTRQWFEKRVKMMSRDELVESGTMMGCEHIGRVRLETDEGVTRIILQPCGSGGRRLQRIAEGKAGKEGISVTMKEEFPLVAGARYDVPMYCTHCPYLFEVLCREWTGQLMWKVIPPQKVGDPCILEVRDDKKY